MEMNNTQFKWDEANGLAKFIADRKFDGVLEGRFYRSDCPRGKIKSVSLPPLPMGYHIFGAKDVPGKNGLPIVTDDWPVFADKEVRFVGQVMFLVVGPDADVVDSIVSSIKVSYSFLPPIFTLEDSKVCYTNTILEKSNVFDAHSIHKGDVDEAFRRAKYIVEETCSTSYQEHMYLETQGAVCYPEDGNIVLEGSMQCPWYVHQTMVTALGHGRVRVIQVPTGGAFGGKEDFPDVLGAPLAVAVNVLKKPIRLIFERTEDIASTTKRHPVTFHYKTGVDEKGNIIAMDINLEINSGAYLSLSGIVLQRSLTTATNVYDIPNVRVNGMAYATNTVPNGAFRGFGSPQTCFAMETHIRHVAERLGECPLNFKIRHFLTSNSHSLTGAKVFGNLVLNELVERVNELSGYRDKFLQYQTIRGTSQKKSKGIGIAIVQHGCGFAGDLEDTLVKAKSRLIKKPNGRVQILVSTTDIGQGLTLTFRKIVATTLEIDLNNVEMAVPDTGYIPDSGPTVASRSIVIVGYILEEAAKKLKAEWQEGEHQEVEQSYCKPAYHQWDQETYFGNAYQATSYGVNVIEVEVDMVTCETRIIGAWATYDVGRAIDSQVFKGQIDGGLVQALGYGGLEKLELDEDGHFCQTTMADYTIPTTLDVPNIVSDLVDNPYPYGPSGAKGGGELTHNGGAAAFAAAIEQAIDVPISSLPVTPEKICELLYPDNNDRVAL